MNKQRIFNVFLIVLAVLSVFAYAKIFLFTGFLQQAEAQVHFVYIDTPPPDEGTVLSGQYNFRIQISPFMGVDSVFITVPSYDDMEMYCELEHDGAGYWYGPCDTMAFDNTTSIGLEVRARNSAGGDIKLQRMDGYPPVFYFAIDNTYAVEAELPEDGNVGYGTLHLFGHLSGDTGSATFDIVPADPTMPVITLQAQKESGSQGESTWSAVWDTSTNGVVNGDYTVHFSFVTLGGTVRQNVASATVTVCNPDWECNQWSECSADGTRTCLEPYDSNFCSVDYGLPLTETCTYSPPPECTPDWICAEWGLCVDGLQTCDQYEDLQGCNVDYTGPALEQECSEGEPEGEPSTPPANQPLSQPAVSYPQAGSQIRDDQPTVTGLADPGTIVKVYLDNVLNGQTSTLTDGSFSYRLANPLPAGNYQIFAVAVVADDEGRVSMPSEPVTFELLSPHLVMTVPKEGDVITGTVTLTAVIEGTISNLDFYYFPIEGGRINYLVGAGRPTSNNPAIWEKSWDTSNVPDGRHNLYAKVQDRAGSFYESNRVEVTIDHQMVPETPPATPEEEIFTDTDNDGVPDNIEIELGTDPHQPDENINPEVMVDKLVAEGQLSEEAGERIKSDLERVVFEEPIESGTLAPEKLKIVKIENFSPKIGQNNLIIKGVGPPNTYVTLFIYSSPIVVTTKTDASGNFTYTLDKNLLDGKHEVYVTVTDETGKIKEKSAPFAFFVRRAQAVSEEEYLRGDVNVEAESAALVSNYLIVAIVIVGVVIIVLLLAYFLSRKRSKTT